MKKNRDGDGCAVDFMLFIGCCIFGGFADNPDPNADLSIWSLVGVGVCASLIVLRRVFWM